MRPALLATLEFPPQIGGIAEYLRSIVSAFPPGALHVLASLSGDTHELDMRSDTPIYRRTLLWRWLRPLWRMPVDPYGACSMERPGVRATAAAAINPRSPIPLPRLRNVD